MIRIVGKFLSSMAVYDTNTFNLYITNMNKLCLKFNNECCDVLRST